MSHDEGPVVHRIARVRRFMDAQDNTMKDADRLIDKLWLETKPCDFDRVGVLIDAAKRASPSHRSRALAAAVREDSDRVRAFVRSATTDPSPKVRKTALSVRAKLPERFELLLSGLDDPDTLVRGTAAKELGELGRSEAMEPLLSALSRVREHESEETAQEISLIAEALAALGGPQARAALHDILRNGTHGRISAASGLARFPDEATASLLGDTLSDASSWVRDAAAHSLSSLGPRAEKAIAYVLANGDAEARAAAMQTASIDVFPTSWVLRGLEDEAPQVRENAAVAAGKRGMHAALDALVELLNGQPEKVRIAAAVALGRLGDRRAIRPLRAVLRRNDWVEPNPRSGDWSVGDVVKFVLEGFGEDDSRKGLRRH